jgi:hypothetical protein
VWQSARQRNWGPHRRVEVADHNWGRVGPLLGAQGPSVPRGSVWELQGVATKRPKCLEELIRCLPPSGTSVGAAAGSDTSRTRFLWIPRPA